MSQLIIISTILYLAAQIIPFAIANENRICQGIPDGRFVNNPTSCAAYWLCLGGETFGANCPDGLNFNEAEQLCDEYEFYPCTDGPPTPLPPTERPPTSKCTGLPNGHFINNPVNCQAYWVCWNELPFNGTCPPDFNFNETGQLCDYPENYPCNQFICPPNGIHVFEKERSCTEFHFCFAGSHSVQSCAPGLHFSSELRHCVLPAVANCQRDRCPEENDINNIVTFPSEHSCEE